MPPARTGGQPPDIAGDGLTASRTASRRRSRAILPATARRTAGRNTAPDGGRRTRDSLTARRRQPHSVRGGMTARTARTASQPRKQRDSATAGRRIYTAPATACKAIQPATAAIINRAKDRQPRRRILSARRRYTFLYRLFAAYNRKPGKAYIKPYTAPAAGCKPFKTIHSPRGTCYYSTAI